MSLWRQLTRGLRALANGSAADREVGDEVQHYLDEAVAAHRARGLSRDDALRAARLELGGARAVTEQVRVSGWEHLADTVLTDVRYAIRRLLASPGFSTIAVLTLALGVGASTAIFSAVSPILFEPLPYPGADRIVAIREMQRDGSRNPGTFGMYRELVARSRSFDALAVLRSWQPTLTGVDRAERFEGQRVSASYFRVLGVSPAIGRDFDAADDQPGAPNVVIISYAVWRQRFAGDPAIIGRALTLDDVPHVVIGVMPDRFENVLAPAATMWVPLQYDMSQGRAWGHHLRTVGRLRAGVSVERATGELGPIGNAVLAELRPPTYGTDVRLIAAPLHDEVVGGVRPALLAILGAVTLVLVIACVNVANLLLARGVRRRGEFALRAALGAGHGRLMRQLLTESVVLATVAGALGIGAAVFGVRALVALSPPGLPRLDAIAVDGRSLAFALAITTLIGLAFGSIPALQAARSDPQSALQGGSRRTAGGHRRTRGALVVGEIALALTLLVSSGLLLRSLDRLFAIPTGFDPAELLTMQIQTAGQRFNDDTTSDRYFESVLEAARGVPGVTAAALTSQLPLSGDVDEFGVRPASTTLGFNSYRYGVSPGYLEAMRIPIRRGRAILATDVTSAPAVAVISESLARTMFPNTDPIGERIEIGPPDGPKYTVIGIAGDVKQLSLSASESSAAYVPASQWLFAEPAMSLVVRARGDAATLVPALRDAVWSVDKDQPIVRVALMADLVAATAAERRFALILFEAFALAALLLAAAGTFGVVSGSVAERTREIGVRSALGASRGEIVGLVLRQGMTLTGFGVLIGLAGAAFASQAIAAMLFGVSRADPATYVGVTVLLAAVSLLACAVPAWRAARVDPSITLRAE